MKQDFLSKIEDAEYIFIRPHELRKRFTEYVILNKARAMLPSRTIVNSRKSNQMNQSY
jgi:hypothetical protein